MANEKKAGYRGTKGLRTVTIEFEPQTIKRIDELALKFDPIRPKRSSAVRFLVKLGYEAWLEAGRNHPAVKP